MIYTIHFTQEQLGIIDQALQQLPYKLAAPMIDHVNKEIQASLLAAAEAVKEKLE
jgi:hypothetical protein